MHITKAELKSLTILLDYCEPDETKHWEECGKPGVHVYNHIKILRGLERKALSERASKNKTKNKRRIGE